MKTLLILLMISTAAAQSPTPTPSFDAASIKQNHAALTGNGGGGILPGGRVSMKNGTVRLLIELAYGLVDYQLGAGPAWTETTYYDVEARPASATDPKISRVMLQNLLAERFSLKVHHEDALVNGFHLVVDKGGSKLKTSDAAGMGFGVSLGKIQGSGGDMRNLVSALQGTLRAPVEDHTGIAGKFDIDLRWTPDNPVTDEPSVTIFAAIRQQLGLSLETTKVSIDRMVIDRVERPTEN